MADSQDGESSPAKRVTQVVAVIALALGGGGGIMNAIRLGRPPWAWTSGEWSNCFNFLGPRNQPQTVEGIEWQRFSASTRTLWDQAPRTLDDLKSRLGVPAASPAPGVTPSPGSATPEPSPNTDSSEHRLALDLMRAGIEHFQASPLNRSELAPAKKCFEDAEVHLDKAAESVTDDRERTQIDEDRNTVGRYLDDCRAREKS